MDEVWKIRVRKNEIAAEIAPVSYTHLDVYKRQGFSEWMKLA